MTAFQNQEERREVVARALAAALLFCLASDARARDEAESRDPPAGTAPTQVEPSPSGVRVIEEIVVTANRRVQNLQEVVGGVRVFAGEDLEKSGSAGFADYVFKIPGADFADDGGARKIAVRGVSNMATNSYGLGTTSPVAIYLNDTPIQGSGVLPDLDLYDLERIEVLKGPQGTLYGEGAQGGAFKMLLNAADPSEFHAKGEVGVGQTKNGSGLDHLQKAAVNVPITGTWALRLVGSRKVDQGYVDFPNRGTSGENDATNLMGRLHVDGEVLENLGASIMILHQRQRLDQFSTVTRDEGDLANRNSEGQFLRTNFTIAALTLDYDLGFATLTSASSGFWNDREAVFRAALVDELANSSFGPGFEDLVRDLAPENQFVEADNQQFGITQELRLVSNGDSWIDWVVGGFYRMRENDFYSLTTNDLSNDPPPAGPGIVEVPGVEEFSQIAFFGNGTIALPWDLELDVGLRWFREDFSLAGTTRFGGAFYALAVSSGEPDGEFPPLRFGDVTTAFTPKVSLSWFADESRMLYAQFAEGVRSGGGNPDTLWKTIPPLFQPDLLRVYEVGAKTAWFDGLLTANVAAFYNDWRDLQLEPGSGEGNTRGAIAVPAGGGGLQNVGRAFVRGVELELSALPLEDWILGFSLFVGEGKIVSGDLDIPPGSRVPQLANLSYAAFAGYEANAWSFFGFTPSLQFDMQSTGDRTAAPPRQAGSVDYRLDGFQTFNVLLGFASEHWEASVGVRNLTDARQQIGVNFLETDILTVGRPRSWLARIGFRM